jgi:hypothetical protein
MPALSHENMGNHTMDILCVQKEINPTTKLFIVFW